MDDAIFVSDFPSCWLCLCPSGFCCLPNPCDAATETLDAEYKLARTDWADLFTETVDDWELVGWLGWLCWLVTDDADVAEADLDMDKDKEFPLALPLFLRLRELSSINIYGRVYNSNKNLPTLRLIMASMKCWSPFSWNKCVQDSSIWESNHSMEWKLPIFTIDFRHFQEQWCRLL